MVQSVKIDGINSDNFRKLCENSDSIRRDMQRLANSLEELVKCLENNNQSSR